MPSAPTSLLVALLLPAGPWAGVAGSDLLDAVVHPGRAGDRPSASMSGHPDVGDAGLPAARPIAHPPAQDRAVDGIAAVVNGEVISIGEVHQAQELLRQPRLAPLAGGCGALPAGMAPVPPPAPATAAEPGSVGSADREDEAVDELPPVDEVADPTGVPAEQIGIEQVVECLIDGILVFREVRRFPGLAVTPEAVQEAFTGLVEAFESRQAFDESLRRHELTPRQVRHDLEQRLLVAAYIDSRFRATVRVDPEAVQRMWEEELAPEMREQGIDVPPLDAVAEEYVRPILREREVNRRIQSWIRDLRRRAEIRRLYPADQMP